MIDPSVIFIAFHGISLLLMGLALYVIKRCSPAHYEEAEEIIDEIQEVVFSEDASSSSSSSSGYIAPPSKMKAFTPRTDSNGLLEECGQNMGYYSEPRHPPPPPPPPPHPPRTTPPTSSP